MYKQYVSHITCGLYSDGSAGLLIILLVFVCGWHLGCLSYWCNGFIGGIGLGQDIVVQNHAVCQTFARWRRKKKGFCLVEADKLSLSKMTPSATQMMEHM